MISEFLLPAYSINYKIEDILLNYELLIKYDVNESVVTKIIIIFNVQLNIVTDIGVLILLIT